MKKFHLTTAMAITACMLGMSAPVLAGGATGANVNTRTNTTANMDTNREAPRVATGRIDRNAEDRYWRDNFSSRPYYERGEDFSTYRPAYQYGADMYERNQGRDFGALNENELRQGWENRYGSTTGMDWNEARGPVMDSYNRLSTNNGVSGTGDFDSTFGTGNSPRETGFGDSGFRSNDPGGTGTGSIGGTDR